jgi:DNA invertase Pin-like site-specific DNA recombinase
MKVIGYTRVSTDEQGRSGAGLEVQRGAIEREAAHRGWELVEVVSDVASGRTTNGRPGLDAALDRLGAKDADGLLVAKLDRLSRSVSDFALLMDRARSEGWAVVALDLNIDTTTATGEMMANLLAALAQWERRLIGERTRDALAVKRSQGVRLGRPPGMGAVVPSATRERIFRLRRKGRTLARIAEHLNYLETPTPTGQGRWHPNTVKRVLATKGQRSLPA